jgi:hypothetical protein
VSPFTDRVKPPHHAKHLPNALNSDMGPFTRIRPSSTSFNAELSWRTTRSQAWLSARIRRSASPSWPRRTEMHVGDRPRRAAQALAPDAAHDRDQRLRERIEPENPRTLILEGGTADLDEPGVVCAAPEADLPQRTGAEGRNGRRSRLRRTRGMEALDGGVIAQRHPSLPAMAITARPPEPTLASCKQHQHRTSLHRESNCEILTP